jgi:hypothetical protein
LAISAFKKAGLVPADAEEEGFAFYGDLLGATFYRVGDMYLSRREWSEEEVPDLPKVVRKPLMNNPEAWSYHMCMVCEQEHGENREDPCVFARRLFGERAGKCRQYRYQKREWNGLDGIAGYRIGK